MTIPRRFPWRRAPRQPAGWFGKYMLEERADGRWDPCRVIDVSPGGAGLELLGVPATIGDALVVELQTPTVEVVGPALRAEVRHVSQGYEGGPVVGIEFTDIDDTGRSILTHLVGLQSA
jgi:hypothetical protein